MSVRSGVCRKTANGCYCVTSILVFFFVLYICFQAVKSLSKHLNTQQDIFETVTVFAALTSNYYPKSRLHSSFGRLQVPVRFGKTTYIHVQGVSVYRYLAQGAIFSASRRLRQNPAPPVANQNRTSLWDTHTDINTHWTWKTEPLCRHLKKKHKEIFRRSDKLPCVSLPTQ